MREHCLTDLSSCGEGFCNGGINNDFVAIAYSGKNAE